MARASRSDLDEIVDTNHSDTALDIFINQANRLVSNELDTSDLSLSNDQLSDIELQLAAHFTKMSKEKDISSESIADRSYDSLVEGGKGLDGTTFGQNAKKLDTSGTLEALDSEDRQDLLWSVTGRSTN